MKIKFLISIISLLLLYPNCMVQAAETAIVTVHTAQVNEEGTFTVGVYISGAENIGGVEFSMVYNPENVTYVESSLSPAFAGQFGETNNIEEKATVKCVAAFNEGIYENTEVFHVVFKSKKDSVNVYQPQLQVIDLVDATPEISDIPYQVRYQ